MYRLSSSYKPQISCEFHIYKAPHLKMMAVRSSMLLLVAAAAFLGFASAARKYLCLWETGVGSGLGLHHVQRQENHQRACKQKVGRRTLTILPLLCSRPLSSPL